MSPGVRRAVVVLLAAVLTAALPSLVPGAGATAGTGGPGETTAGRPVAQPGASGVGDEYFPQAGNGGYDAERYALDLAYDPGRRHLVGHAVLTARATQPLSRFDLDLTGFTVRSVTVDGRPARFTRRGQELVITPRSPLHRGRAFSVSVRYDGRPPQLRDATGIAVGWVFTDYGAFVSNEPDAARGWFPANDHPGDKARYKIQVTVPRGTAAIANGRLLDQRTRHGRTTFRWQPSEPMASYLVTVTIGRFRIHAYRAPGGLPILDAVDPREAAAARRVLTRTPAMIAYFGQVFGPYPFSTYGQIVDHAPAVGYALETQTRSLFASAPDEATAAHELAHQWYGDSVTPQRWRDIWLNEGFATYAEWLWQAHTGARSVERAFDRAYATPAGDELWQVAPGDPGVRHLFHRAVYDRGAMTLHVLRRTVGDRTFFAILRAWASRHRYGNAGTAQFVALAERLSGRRLGGLFRTWLYTTGKPALS